MHSQATQALTATQTAGHDQLTRARNRPPKARIAFTLAFVLDQQHLAAQRPDNVAAFVAYGEDFLQHRRSANHGCRDLVAYSTVEQHAEHQRRLFAGHRSANGHRQRVRAGHGHRLGLGHHDHLVVGPGEQHGIGVCQVGQQRQVPADVFEQRPILGRQLPARIEWAKRAI